MGYHVNPRGETKEAFLEREGKLCSPEITWTDVPQGYVLVVLVDNGWMTAAGIIVDEAKLRQERERGVMHPRDPRPWKLYSVPTEIVLNASDLARHPKFRNAEQVRN